MDFDKLLKLLDAGFTKADIMAMMTAAPKAEDPKPSAPAPAPKAEDPKPAAPATSAPADRSDEILDAIARLTGAIQTMNLKGNYRAEPTPAPTADDVLTQIFYSKPTKED